MKEEWTRLLLLWGLDILILALFLLAFFLRRRRGSRLSAEESKFPFCLVIPLGAVMDRLLGGKGGGLLKQQGLTEKEEIHQLLRDISGREEGERQFRLYRARRWGGSLAALWILLTFFCITRTWSAGQDRSLSGELLRPEYGQGDLKTRLELVVSTAEGTGSSSFNLKIPEQVISEEAAQEGLAEAVTLLETYYQGIVTNQDLFLTPLIKTAHGSAAITYRSLNTDSIRSSGELTGEPGEEPVHACLLATVALEGRTKEVLLNITIQSDVPATPDMKAETVAELVEKGAYTGETGIYLPSETEEGETITWRYAPEDNSFLWALLFVLVPALVIAKQDSDYKQLSEKRLAQIRSGYPEFLGDLVILMGAGASLRSAWIRLGKDYRERRKGTDRSSMLLDEVEKTALELEEGASIKAALTAFAARIPVREIRRFTTLLIQDMKRGDSYLLVRLKEMADGSWEARKKLARERSEEVDTKLMLPLMMMLVVILIMVISPAIISMKF
ncbi:MAG: hypothetical protein HUJ69_03640 [Lachnospiraceae bacterium]|nr:hypothetical protein [Lachnospiraceae bacterium]